MFNYRRKYIRPFQQCKNIFHIGAEKNKAVRVSCSCTVFEAGNGAETISAIRVKGRSHLLLLASIWRTFATDG